MAQAITRFYTLSAAVAAVATVLSAQAAGPGNFKPDGMVTGSALSGWHIVGDADWKAQDGELVGKAKGGGNGGWLVMDKSFQDVQLYANYRCTGQCTSGILLRAQKTAVGGMNGVYVSLTDGDTASYFVTIDAQGKEVARERLAAPAGRGGGGSGNPGRGAAAPGTGGAAPAARGAEGGGGAAGPPAQPAPAPAAAAGQTTAPPPPPGQQTGASGRRPPVLKNGEWNPVYILLAAATLRPTFGGAGALDEKNANGYGPVAIFVGGSGEVRYKDFAWKNLNAIAEPAESISPNYTMLRVSNLYYGWGATTGDINRDGVPDIVSGPFYYVGPAFTERRIYREGRVYNPATEFAPDMVNLAFDFTGDGWTDILSTLGNRHMDLYVNPKGESRRWDKFSVLTTNTTEIALMRDLDKDGKPEIVFGGGGVYAWAAPDPAKPTDVWAPHPISSPGQAVNGHGIGVGDINGDAKVDIVVPTGWYEQPAGGISKSPWTFHANDFGNNSVFGNGGGEMGVYDVNGDGLADVVAGSAHNWGMNWFEQRKAADGTRTFVQHSIAQDFSTTNAGNVVFSESHAARFVDMDGDKIPDFVTGKRLWSELENYTGPDPYGAPVLYVYKTVRNPKAPGGAEFVPQLVHNRSGVGSSFDVEDLNKDGRPDIVTAATYGTFVFFSKPATR
jgi:3-keto-disaccharide hydrolase/FG-GAP-like repeat/FG-GAP repeat